MKILFDQGTPVPLRRFLDGHEVHTVFEKGWDRLTNGDVLAVAILNGYEVPGSAFPKRPRRCRATPAGGPS